MKKPRKPLTDKDGEVREITAEDMKYFRPIREVDPGMIEAMAAWKKKLARGRPKVAAPRRMISFRLPPDIISGIKARGRGYNARVEKVLREALDKGKL